MRLEDGDLPLEAKDAAMHHRLVRDHRRVVEQIARREIVGAVHDHIVVRDDAGDVGFVEPLVVQDDLHIGIEALDRLAGGFRLAPADPRRRVDDLSLQVARLDHVGVYQAQCADAGRRQIQRGGSTQAACPQQQHLSVQQLELARLADLRHQQMAAIALALLVA